MQTPIAIIGIGCRFPGAANARAFWKLVSEGASAIARMPAERHGLGWISNGQPDPWGGFLKEVDRFDAAFFGIAPEEAQTMDPQQRLLLETAWEALEDAAIIPKSLAGSDTGVFMGLSSYNYGSIAQLYPAAINRFTNTGVGGSVAANRISYFLDLQGPGFCVDGACASSLLAVYAACQSIWAGESTVALAGGANLTLLSGPTLGLAKSGLLSPDGACRVFDAGANGTVRGEGAAVVALKSLPRAQADGDPIYAVIRGIAVNQNGRSNGLGAPNRRVQEALLRQAYRHAGISPGRVQYVEAHSTASLIGDATELAAAGAVLQEGRNAGDRCAIGSVKPNIGHLEAAAGIAGLIKTALMLKRQQMPPTLNFRQPNPHVPLDRLGLKIQTELSPWPGEAGERIAGVSATGYGGVNIHVVLGDLPETPPAPSPHVPDSAVPGPRLFALSAKSQPALRQMAGEFAEWIDATPDVEMANLCHTVNCCRTRFSARLGLVANDPQELRERLREFAAGRPDARSFHNAPSGGSAIHSADADDAVLHQAALFVQGKEPDAAIASAGGARIHGVPGYCFQRETYWLPTAVLEAGQSVAAIAPIVPVPDQIPLNDRAQFGVSHFVGSAPRTIISVRPETVRGADPTLTAQADLGSEDVPLRAVKNLSTASAKSDSIEQRVLSLFEEVLKISPIRSDDHFFNLGGCSAQVLELSSLVERKLGKMIPLIHFYESPTPQNLAKLVAMDENEMHWKPVITLNEGGKRPALYFIPGLGGHAFAMRAFAERLGPDQPISVMHPQGLDPNAVALTSIEEMARVFLAYMRKTQPRGPYHLGGYSFGGSVAFEMACQLQAQGETVQTLALLDAYAPEAFRKRSLPHRLMNHAKMIYSSGARKEYIQRRVGRLWDRLRAAATGEQPAGAKPTGAVVDAVRRVTYANQQAWRSYRPGRFDGRIALFRALDTDPMIAQFVHCDDRNGWAAHVAQVDLLVLPCHHLELFEGGNLDLMTDRIADLLRPPQDADAPLRPVREMRRVG